MCSVCVFEQTIENPNRRDPESTGMLCYTVSGGTIRPTYNICNIITYCDYYRIIMPEAVKQCFAIH